MAPPAAAADGAGAASSGPTAARSSKLYMMVNGKEYSVGPGQVDPEQTLLSFLRCGPNHRMPTWNAYIFPQVPFLAQISIPSALRATPEMCILHACVQRGALPSMLLHCSHLHARKQGEGSDGDQAWVRRGRLRRVHSDSVELRRPRRQGAPSTKSFALLCLQKH